MSEISLYGVGGSLSGAIFQLDGNATLIGRDNQRCSIIYPPEEPGISAVHCQVIAREGYIEITDLGSSYGTFLDTGIRFDRNVPYQLRNGDSFYLGPKQNKFIVKIK